MKSRVGKPSVLACAIGVAFVTLYVTGCSSKSEDAPEAASQTAQAAAEPAAEPGLPPPNPDRDVYFGQTHVHTSWSLDAYVIGNTVTGPEEAYLYAMGEPVQMPGGQEVRLSRPLDFQGVTDHSEYVGMVKMANDPSSPISKLPIAEKLKANTPEEINKAFQFIAGSMATGERIEDLLKPELIADVWQRNIDIADKYYKPGEFTTFVAYEWTALPGGGNMHRNVFFRDSKNVPKAPFTAVDSVYVEDLWTWMDAQRKEGSTLLSISHNGNLSDGLMFPTEMDSKGRPIDAAWAQQRLDNEPLTEARQTKGTSETHPLLSPDDEFADYELMSYLIGRPGSTSKVQGSYMREAWANGLMMQEKLGYNPYKFGVLGGSDSHNTVVAYTQDKFFGAHAFADGTPEARLAGKVESGMEVLKTGTSGLAGVWAEQNTRESIYDAMHRKEIYGTTGVRIKVRLFGGWGYEDNIFDSPDWVSKAYQGGVPMGADLAPKAGEVPTFLVWATKDPDDANLDRVQIIKSWTKDGEIFEHVYDVAWSGDRTPGEDGKVPAVESTVDVAKATYTNDVGAVELKSVWRDPSFDPALHAVYYVRVLQIPTPRWSTYDAAKLGVEPPKGVPATVQERAWTSPIWYSPTVSTVVSRTDKTSQ